MLIFSGKPDMLTVEVLLKDESGARVPASFPTAETHVQVWSYFPPPLVPSYLET